MNKKGVTLIEIIVVLVILAIGSALAYPNLRWSLTNQKKARVEASLRTIAHCLRLYRMEHGNVWDPSWFTTGLVATLHNEGCLDVKDLEPYKGQSREACLTSPFTGCPYNITMSDLTKTPQIFWHIGQGGAQMAMTVCPGGICPGDCVCAADGACPVPSLQFAITAADHFECGQSPCP